MKRIVLFLILLSLLFAGCESKETAGAKELLAQAEALKDQGQYTEALNILDSLQKTFPKELDQRRTALNLSRELKLTLSVADSAEMATRLDNLYAELDRRHADFKVVTVPDMPDETLLRFNGYDPSSSVGSSFLDAYIQSDGQLEMVGGIASKTDIVSIRVSAPDGTYEVSDTIPYDGGRNYRFSHDGHTYTRLTFSSEAAKRLGAFIADSETANTRLKVSFLNSGGTAVGSFNLSANARHAISETFAFYATYLDIKNIEGRLSKHEARKAIYQSK